MAKAYQQGGSVTVKIINGQGIEKMLEVTRGVYPFATFALVGDGFGDAESLISAPSG